MIYLRKAFKNGVLIHEQVVTVDFADFIKDAIGCFTKKELIERWNLIGSVGPIKWEYTLLELPEPPKKFCYKRPEELDKLREEMRERSSKFHQRTGNE